MALAPSQERRWGPFMILCDDAEHDQAVVVGRLTPVEAAELQRDLDRFRADALYVDAHREELLAAYPERWIAVHDQQVVAAAADHGALLAQLDARALPAGRVYREFLDADDVDLFL